MVITTASTCTLTRISGPVADKRLVDLVRQPIVCIGGNDGAIKQFADHVGCDVHYVRIILFGGTDRYKTPRLVVDKCINGMCSWLTSIRPNLEAYQDFQKKYEAILKDQAAQEAESTKTLEDVASIAAALEARDTEIPHHPAANQAPAPSIAVLLNDAVKGVSQTEQFDPVVFRTALNKELSDRPSSSHGSRTGARSGSAKTTKAPKRTEIVWPETGGRWARIEGVVRQAARIAALGDEGAYEAIAQRGINISAGDVQLFVTSRAWLHASKVKAIQTALLSGNELPHHNRLQLTSMLAKADAL